MHIALGRAACSRWLGRVFSIERNTSVPPSSSELPLYLCPALRSLSVGNPTRPRCHQHASLQTQQIRRLQTHANEAITSSAPSQPTKLQTKTLPTQCHGCGALSQTTVPGEAGYYDVTRKAIRQYLGLEELEVKPRRGEEIVKRALEGVDLKALEEQGIDLSSLLPQQEPESDLNTTAPATDKPPLCDRCHNLIHHSTGNSIFHPSIESIQNTIQDSPYKYNHIYHVLDAADFPMSLVPRLHSALDVALRTQNRRARTSKFYHGRKTEMSFVITRSDLLAPTKEQVDRLMPYVKETLREALGRIGGRVRLGNVRFVSAKRNWWTSELKEEIFERGGAGWMVGRVNVGKSQLFQAVFPKGRIDAGKPPKRQISVDVFPGIGRQPHLTEDADEDPIIPGLKADSVTDLLPPPLPETQYPPMPIISSLPGTTASPIRVPYGGGKGELIDLPGLSRGDLELCVQEEHRQDLIMKSRIVPEQQVLKPGQSLLLGGFIRITPRNVAPEHELVFLAYAFTPIEAHTTSTDKAIAVQEQAEDAPRVQNIALPGVGRKAAHAGAYQLRYDVTKQRTGPLTSKVAVGLKVDRLPYRVLGIDVLIEGCGWVELTVQVRTRQLFAPRTERPNDKVDDPFSKLGILEKLDLRPEPVNALKEDDDADAEWDNRGFDDGVSRKGDEEVNWPVIDVYSPEGRFIGHRKPMNAWLLNKPKKGDIKSRPRRSMKGQKKLEKQRKKESYGTQSGGGGGGSASF